MGLLDWLLGPEEPQRFSSQTWSPSDPAFAAWLRGDASSTQEQVTAKSALGLSAVLRAVSIISTTIAGLPLRTYEGTQQSRVRVPSEFDDPYPGVDGMTPFEWVETVLLHLLLWRGAFLWHEKRADGSPGFAYRPMDPDTFKVKRVNGRRVFEYTEAGSYEPKEVGSEQITYIPGPSIDATSGHPLLHGARAVFSAAISGDRTAQRVLRRGIRIAGLATPADGEEDFEPDEGKVILEQLRADVMGSDNAGDIALINRKLKLQPWQSSNIEAQWHETLMWVLMEIEQLFGVPPHLMADTEKQTSWGSGVAEQNLGLARFTLRGWSDRIEQRLSQRLPRGQFTEFDYKGLLQGTPQQEIATLITEVSAGILTPDEARAILNLPALTPAQRTVAALRAPITDAGVLTP